RSGDARKRANAPRPKIPVSPRRSSRLRVPKSPRLRVATSPSPRFDSFRRSDQVQVIDGIVQRDGACFGFEDKPRCADAYKIRFARTQAFEPELPESSRTLAQTLRSAAARQRHHRTRHSRPVRPYHSSRQQNSRRRRNKRRQFKIVDSEAIASTARILIYHDVILLRLDLVD